ncbi:hypothetical protein MA16_Dca020404 [Dendrobium catenatum]|uniref:Uncharacterized protein n=1 Tax=Dendrobium catenatum TaxID=906689 RepID=A0A2I0VVP4_9ASPA|nr:hypothetical protein MA16_Dca020404 [Dendrobium catenatum]
MRAIEILIPLAFNDARQGVRQNNTIMAKRAWDVRPLAENGISGICARVSRRRTGTRSSSSFVCVCVC